MLCRCGLGVGGLSLAGLLADAGMLAAAETAPGAADPLAAKAPHFAAKAKRIIHIFPEGGPSHLDTFDPKPTLTKYHGKNVNDVIRDYTKNAPKAAAEMNRLGGTLAKSGFKFEKRGKSGIDVSELFPKLAAHIDDLCVVRSMTAKSSVHEPAQLSMNTGEATVVRPSMGSWITYGLGAANRDLPAFIALTPGGPASGDKHWSNAFLPSYTAGTSIRTNDIRVEKMIENIRSGFAGAPQQRRQLDLLMRMNRRHLESRGGPDDYLEGRINSFETAFRMQAEATDAFDISKEPTSIRELYGDTPQGRQLLLARRLAERGVRFVQVWHGGWDSHSYNDRDQKKRAEECDQPLAALLADLKSRGMLDDTLVLWAGEFGRTPTVDVNDPSRTGVGRDHNAGGFTVWMAGGGVKGGCAHGATDDFGAVAVEGRMDVHDLHATILHLLGFDHTKLTFRYAGRDFRLTDVHGHVVRELLA